MTRSNHVAYGSWIFGFILLGFVIAVFWFAPDSLPPFKQQILAFSSALAAGLFGFFLTGDIALLMKHKESSTTLKAAGGIALFVVVLGWWQTSSAPVPVADNPASTPSSTSTLPASTLVPTPTITTSTQLVATSQDTSIQTKKDIKIRADKEGGQVNVITGNGQILKGKNTSGGLNQHTVAPAKSGISTEGSLIIESTGKDSQVNVITGNGQVQEAE